MRMNSLNIRDVKLLTFGQASDVFEEVTAELDTRCSPDYIVEELLSVNEVLELVKASLEDCLRQSLIGAHQQLFTPPWENKGGKI